MSPSTAPPLDRPARSDSTTAARLRADFDQVFARPAATEHATQQVFLGARIGGDPYALALDTLTGLHALKTVVSMPSRGAHFLGLVGLAGHIVPVFRLPALLGYTVADEKLRWIALCGPQAPIGLAFETVEGTSQVDPKSLSLPHPTALRTQHVNAVLRTAEATRSVLDINEIILSITQAALRPTPVPL